MKRTALKRGKPLQRKTWMRRRRKATRRSERVEDPYLLAGVHDLPCCAAGLLGHRCRGRIEADHAGLHPIGRQSHDTEVIPLASACHKNRTNPRTGGRGPFDRMTPAGRRAWRAQQIARVQTWWYGRPLTASDLPIVTACVAAGRTTWQLFAAVARAA